MRKKLLTFCIFIFLALCVLVSCVTFLPASQTKIVVFGDSLSDTGYANLLTKKSGWPNIPGTKDKKLVTYTTPSEYPTVWPQQLEQAGWITNSKANNLEKIPRNKGSVAPNLDGNIYAAGGAATSCQGIGSNIYTPPPIGPSENKNCKLNKYNQIDSYLKQNGDKANPNAIYIIWGGANNAFMAMQKVKSGGNPIDAISIVKNAAMDIINDVHYLEKKGARKIIVLAMPNLKITPIITDNGKNSSSDVIRFASGLSRTFNNKLEDDLAKDSKNKAKVIFLRDDIDFFDKIVANKHIAIAGKTFDFTNVKQSACEFDGENALTCIPRKGTRRYLFAGQVHPTKYAHKALARYIYFYGIRKF